MCVRADHGEVRGGTEDLPPGAQGAVAAARPGAADGLHAVVCVAEAAGGRSDEVCSTQYPKSLRVIMENITEVLHNYYLVCQWHRRPFEESSFDMETLHAMNVMEKEAEEIGEESEKVSERSRFNGRI